MTRAAMAPMIGIRAATMAAFAPPVLATPAVKMTVFTPKPKNPSRKTRPQGMGPRNIRPYSATTNMLTRTNAPAAIRTVVLIRTSQVVSRSSISGKALPHISITQASPALALRMRPDEGRASVVSGDGACGSAVISTP
ncbi:MAG: hypothetical protein CMM46_06055 [Rhodospirillaceae bacterium]|nr:hypothetical protein [Rhodospirillaceae bacterium]